MKAHIIFILSVFSGMALISCTERIDIKLDESTVRLVVDGSVSTDTMAQKIILSKTTSYYYNQKPPAVSGASMSISSGGKNIKLSESTPGVYQTDSTFYGITGKTYTLNIRLTAPVGGYMDYSATSSMSEAVKLDSVHLIYHPDWSEAGFYEVSCFFKDPPTPDYYRFLIYRNGKMITDTINKWFISDDRFFNNGYVDGASVAFLDQSSENEKLQTGDDVTVELNCITKEYAGFISDVQAELIGSYPLFSGPPANVKGNIDNGAIGFFAAYTISRAKAKVGK